LTLRLLTQLAEHARQRPDATAIVYRSEDQAQGQQLTYAALHGAVVQLTRRLTAQTQGSDVIILCCSNRPQYTVGFLSALAAGTKLLAVSPQSAEAEWQQAGEQTGARCCIGDRKTLDALRPLVDICIELEDVPLDGQDAEAIAHRDSDTSQLLLQSSGTTGLPKIVCRTGPSLDAVAVHTAKAVGMTAGDRILCALPLCHSYGMEHGLVAPLIAGAAVHLHQGFDLTVAGTELCDGGATIFPGVPFMYESLMRLEAPDLNGHEGSALGDLRCAYSAGGPLPRSVFDGLKQKFGLTVGQLYGATEIGSVTFNPPDDDDLAPDSVGYPMDQVVIKVIDADDPQVDDPLPPDTEGHVAVRAASMLSTYLGHDSPLHDGFFLTGDLGRIDQRGRLFITGRIKLMIDIGGLKVSPIEVEQVLMRHPQVTEAAVVPVSVSDTLARLKAVITSPDSAQSVDVEDIRRFCRKSLAPHKVPRLIEVRRQLPKTPSGKILRRALET